MKYRIREHNGVFYPQFFKYTTQEGTEIFHSCKDEDLRNIVKFSSIAGARAYLDNEMEKERIANIPPIYHEYP